jgi:UDP-N-acetylmuramate--alanine ligase
MKTGYDWAQRRIKRVHFIGIGGAGMSGIAEVIKELGYNVSGSDIASNAVTQRLSSLGCLVFKGHQSENVKGVDVVVVSSAINEQNPEIIEARANNIPIVRRAEMLAEIMRFRQGIAVAGTHGKTTTTSIVSSLLIEAGLDPTYIIGGKLNSAGSNSRLGKGEYLVAEADESDASFLYLQAMIAVVTNIDADHLSTYGGDFGKLKDTFVEFLHHLPFYGLAVLCMDDEHVRDIIPRVNRPMVTYGIHYPADVRALNVRYEGMKSHFTLACARDGRSFDVTLNMPGEHNVLNALAAVAIAAELEVPDDIILRALNEFGGVGRRFQSYGDIETDKGTITLIDDYGHHPTEMQATIQAVKDAWSDRRMVVLFQPHRYTRTRDLFDDFAQVLSESEVLIMMDVYAASEKPIAGADGRSLARSIRNRNKVDPVFVADDNDVVDTLKNILKDGDVLLTLGAGSVGTIATNLPNDLAKVTGDE